MPQQILVIGAGLIGAALGFRLSQAGAQVTLIDMGAIGGATSARSFGWINANAPDTPEYFALRCEALAAWRRLDAELGGIGLSGQGTLTWYAGDWSTEAEIAAVTRHGPYAARVVDRDEFARLEPALADPPEVSVLTSDETALDGRAAAERLVAEAARLGARVLNGAAVEGLVEEGGRITGARTGFGTLRADHVVLATGTATGRILEGLGIRLPMDNRPGFILHSRPVAPVLNHILLTPEVHLRQEPDGRIVAGEVFFGEGPNSAEMTTDPLGFGDRLLAAMRVRLPGVAIEPLRAMLGTRPMPADGFPAVGEVAPGLSVVTTHSGVTLSAILAESLAAEILRGEAQPLLAPYRPGRFDGWT
ncbi:FAD-dependent oxidoreductase [Frigidibacter sp. MR17.14]|uniref:NAD(P)/FAD-dependent oxidoreductase n=1 Tax=Frigidibacter sp. MR17.14 TaxID=3126509 RepID=UPI003012F3EF